MVTKKHLRYIGQYRVAYHINMYVCMSYLELPSRGDHHLITSSNQLAKIDGHLIVPPVELIPFLVTIPVGDSLHCWNSPNAQKYKKYNMTI